MFIVIEGVDGSGKSTLTANLKEELEKENFQVVVTREIGGTILGEKIRELVLNDTSLEIDPLTELLLFLASRNELVEKVIKPSLEKGKIVISDRFTPSTLVYQGFAKGIKIKTILKLNKLVVKNFEPDLIIILERKNPETKEINRIDNTVNKEKIIKAYRKISKILPKTKIVTVEKEPKETLKKVKRIILKKIEKRRGNKF